MNLKQNEIDLSSPNNNFNLKFVGWIDFSSQQPTTQQ
jgi:hypothetical protein